MSAFGTFPYYAPPKGLVNTWGVAPNPTLAAWQGCRRRLRLTPTPQPLSICRLQPVKAKPLRGCFASLDRFPAPSASDRFVFSWRWKGVKGGEAVHFTLDALNRPNTRVGVGGLVLPPAPAASQVRVGFGAKPQGLAFGF